MSQASLDPLIESFEDINVIKVLSCSNEQIFDADEMKLLEQLYQQLNPNCCVKYLTPFYIPCGKVSYGGDILGYSMNKHSAVSSSVISAYWPIYANSITEFSLAHRSIGKVLFYFQQLVTLFNPTTQTTRIARYTMARIDWFDTHPDASVYGISATVCRNYTREQSMCSFILTLQINSKCVSFN